MKDNRIIDISRFSVNIGFIEIIFLWKIIHSVNDFSDIADIL